MEDHRLVNNSTKDIKMDYQTVRSIAKDGDVLFLHVDKKNLLSRVTAFFTKSLFTHAAFLFWYKDRLMLVESTTHGGIRIVQASTYSDREITLVSAPKSWTDIEGSALSRSGTSEYGWFSAFYIGLREFFFTHFDVKLPQDKDNRNKACSEFVAEVLELADVDVSPGKLHKMLTE